LGAGGVDPIGLFKLVKSLSESFKHFEVGAGYSDVEMMHNVCWTGKSATGANAQAPHSRVL
jgi:hypothetical protein